MITNLFEPVIHGKEVYVLMCQFIKDYVKKNPLETEEVIVRHTDLDILNIRFSHYKNISFMKLFASLMLIIRDGDDVSHYEYIISNHEIIFNPLSNYSSNNMFARRELQLNHMAFWKEVLQSYFNLKLLQNGSFQLEVHKLIIFKKWVDSQIKDI